jgi:hypothetical protein
MLRIGFDYGDLSGGMMADNPMYHDGMRQLQDSRETRPLADRLEQATIRTAFTDDAVVSRSEGFAQTSG